MSTNTDNQNHDLYSYDTSTQPIITINEHQDVNFAQNYLASSWVHSPGSAIFTCKKTSRYKCIVEVYMKKTASGSQEANIIALFNGAEVPGSHSGIDLITDNEISMYSISFPFDGIEDQDLRIQVAGSNTNVQIVPGPNPGGASVVTSAKINIFYRGK